MTSPALLTIYLLTVAIIVPSRLQSARWVVRAPRVAIALWIGLLASEIAGAAVAGCLVTQSLSGDSYKGALWACYRTLVQYPMADPAARVWSAGGVVLTVGVPAGVGWVLIRDLRRTWRRQRRHVEALDLVGRRLEPSWPPVLLIDHPLAATYCVAARRGRIVVSTGAIRILPQAELVAVLKHERAHLRGRHQLLSLCTASLARALPWVPLFASAGPCVARLVEMAADDAAGKHTCREVVARGLARMATATPNDVAVLSASGGDVAERINRLIDTDLKDQTRSTAVGVGWIAAAVALPAFGLAATMSLLC